MSENDFGGIDPELDHQLRVAVERVARPIVCEEVRKTRMRNELLGHARDRFDDGVRRGLDPQCAADDAIDRMGDPAELTAELQATVCLEDRWAALLNWAVRRQPGTPHWRHAVWMGALSGFGIAALLLVSFAITAGLVSQERVFTPDAVRAMIWLGVSFSITATIAAYFGGLVRERMATNNNRPDAASLGMVLLGGSIIWVEGLAAWLIVGAPAVMFSPVHSACWTALSLIIALSMLVLAWLDIRERRDIEPWLALDID